MTEKEIMVQALERAKLESDSYCMATDCQLCFEEECYLGYMADYLIDVGIVYLEKHEVEECIPEKFVSVLGHMTDAGEFPPVRECYWTGDAFFFPALCEVHPVDYWMEIPE